MNESFEELALRVWKEMAWLDTPEPVQATAFARRIRDELYKGQEPVAYITKRKAGGTEGMLRADMVDRSAKNEETHDFIPLYLHPAPIPAGMVLVAEEVVTAIRWAVENPDSPKSAMSHLKEAYDMIAAYEKEAGK